jgi:hypothetical protein
MSKRTLPATTQVESFLRCGGLYGKPSRSGPEADLVMDFIQSSLPEPGDNESMTVFIEPRLGNLRPDIVIIYWDPDITFVWPTARQFLSLLDLQLIQMLFLTSPLTENELKDFFPARKLIPALDRLYAADCVYLQNEKWLLKELSCLFAIRRIISVEAKLSDVSKALDQAFANTWFSSESYVLTPRKQHRSMTIELARSYGVGLWNLKKDGKVEQMLESKNYPVPFSYGSWVFNEMVWRHNQGISDEYRL